MCMSVSFVIDRDVVGFVLLLYCCVCVSVCVIMCVSFVNNCVVVYVFSVLFVCVCARVCC